MFTINFKGKPHPKDEKLIKLDMILFQTGYPRVSKALNITALEGDWDQTKQCFKSKSKDASSKNNILLNMRLKYQKIAEDWEADGVKWSPVQWSHYFDERENEAPTKKKVRVMTISQCIDTIMENMKNQKRLKNGKFITCTNNARQYKSFKNQLQIFTQEVYGKSLSSYFFKDIDEKFLQDFVIYFQERGIREGTGAGLPEKLKKFIGVFYNANQMGQPYTDKKLFECVQHYIKRKETPPQTISYEIITRIEEMDKSQFSNKEKYWIDLFLFSFYAGGMASVDVCYLTWDCIVDGIIIYERTKFPKEAEMPFNTKAKAIVEKYKNKCYQNYVLPIFTIKHKTELQQWRCTRRLQDKVNRTLKKVSKILKLEKSFTWYAARGTFITKMIDEGYHPIAVAKFAGNSPNTIYKHYWDQTHKEDVLNHMNEMF
ncbi:phage integrase family protein [Dysgonomonas alginatilytica]|uniref:Phage integrase family protein n=1 Tax=Dysgonomonas alginatilytica TaxID=1605892 RepID=A0A2V3PQR2_9BACT|nr:tyrosine-type recombinase/integrase [Dysgonomonas alginatilytica]PXV63766.1 phage integrase family protein [Dysgonomonas alginatilytica]